MRFFLTKGDNNSQLNIKKTPKKYRKNFHDVILHFSSRQANENSRVAMQITDESGECAQS